MNFMQCNLCGSSDLRAAISIPNLPISKDYSGSSERYNLNLHYCNSCGLLQISEPIDPVKLYSSKFYLTGFHQPKHIDDLIITALHYKDPGSIIEIGCNDGSILRELRHYGFTKLVGIEPNEHASKLADGLEIYNEYLAPSCGHIGKFDFVLCRHVIEHVSDIRGFMGGINALINEDGVLILEIPNTELGFDSVSPVVLFEEHVNHFTERALREMLHMYGFDILEKRYYAFGGGSIALICKKSTPKPFIRDLAKYHTFSYYERYAKALDKLKAGLHSYLDANKDHQIILYGAASRSAMFINVMGITDKINYIFDDRRGLHGLTMPGTNLKISGMKNIEKPTLCLMGIGSENEWKIKKYFDKSLSLFAPRFMSSNFVVD